MNWGPSDPSVIQGPCLPSPPPEPEPEDSPPKRSVPPLAPPTATWVPDPPRLLSRNQSRMETVTLPSVEEPVSPRGDSVIFEHDRHEHPQQAEPSLNPCTTPVKSYEPEKGWLSKNQDHRFFLQGPIGTNRPTLSVPELLQLLIPFPHSWPPTPSSTSKTEHRTYWPLTLVDHRHLFVPGAPPPVPRRAPACVHLVCLCPSIPLNQSSQTHLRRATELGADPLLHAMNLRTRLKGLHHLLLLNGE